MNQMLVGLWDVDEHPGEKLERPLRVDRLAVVDIVAGFGLINEETRLRMTGQVDWRAVQVAGEAPAFAEASARQG